MTQPLCWWYQLNIDRLWSSGEMCHAELYTLVYIDKHYTHTWTVLTDDWCLRLDSCFLHRFLNSAVCCRISCVCFRILCVICMYLLGCLEPIASITATEMYLYEMTRRMTALNTTYLLTTWAGACWFQRSTRWAWVWVTPTLCSPRPLYVLFRYLFHERWFDNKCRGCLAGWMSPNQQCQRTTDTWRWRWNSLV